MSKFRVNKLHVQNLDFKSPSDESEAQNTNNGVCYYQLTGKHFLRHFSEKNSFHILIS